jgi:ribonuclease PH
LSVAICAEAFQQRRSVAARPRGKAGQNIRADLEYFEEVAAEAFILVVLMVA